MEWGWRQSPLQDQQKIIFFFEKRELKMVRQINVSDNGLFIFLILGYALDPSIDSPEVATKYIGSVEEAEKNQGKPF